VVRAEIHTANVAYLGRKIQLSGYSVYPDGLPSQLIWISGVLLYFVYNEIPLKIWVLFVVEKFRKFGIQFYIYLA